MPASAMTARSPVALDRNLEIGGDMLGAVEQLDAAFEDMDQLLMSASGSGSGDAPAATGGEAQRKAS